METELKFQVPSARQSQVARALATASARHVPMRAFYVDTPDRRLAAAKLSLRLRREGRDWLQTLKGRGTDFLSRFEHEVRVRPAPGCDVPAIDPNLHAGTTGGNALQAALAGAEDTLQVIFSTDVRRTVRVVRCGDSLIELALDVGELRAGKARAPIAELELELVRGDREDLIALADKWSQRHGLWLDVRSKSERGDQLARRRAAGPVVPASTSPLRARMTAEQGLSAMVGACLEHFLPNAAEIGRGSAEPEHLHQARVALRRLRSVLCVFDSWSSGINPAWRPQLRELFAHLSDSRDQDVLASYVLPALRSAGAPLAELPMAANPARPGEALRGAACNRLMLELIRFAAAAVAAPASSSGLRALRQRIRPIVKNLHGVLCDDAKTFPTQDAAARHRTRRRLKRLRYAVEFVAPLFPAKPVEPYLKRLRMAQDSLGELNDLAMAEPAFRRHVETDARAWFALGWLAARRAELLRNAARELERCADAPHFWRFSRPGKR